MEHDYAKQYGDFQKWHWWFRGRQRIIDAILKTKLNGKLSQAVLSVGCGPSDGLEWLFPATSPGGMVVGLDADKVHSYQKLEKLHFVTGLLGQAPLADNSFDLVLALDVLEHIEDDVAALKDALRLLRKGGLLLVTVPALPMLWGGQDVVSHHQRRYTRRSLATLFNNAGISGYEINYFNTLLFPLAASVRLASRALGINQADNELRYSRPGFTNNLLARIFGIESALITRTRMPIGVSLVATYTSPQ
jgi:SAM-dependent methyltransferase